MKASIIAAVVAPAVLANAQWWGGAPDCAHDCFSSYWSSSSAWPAPTDWCGGSKGGDVSSCVSSACSATPTVSSRYSSMSSSLCSEYSSCSSAGSTATYTMTAPGFTGGAGGPGGKGGYWGAGSFSGGVYTVTGCEWDGSPWAGGPMGFRAGGPGAGPWGVWGEGWTWTTRTDVVTATLTSSLKNAISTTTSTGTATLALAYSGTYTSTSTLNRAEATGNAANRDSAAVKVAGAVLGGAVAVVGLL